MNPLYFLAFVVFADMLLTHVGLVKMKKYVEDFHKMELNPVISFLYKKFPPYLAAIFGAAITITLLSIMWFFVGRNPRFVWIIAGVYFLLLLIHVHTARYVDEFIAYRKILEEERIDIIRGYTK
jgi:hypothetical protein